MVRFNCSEKFKSATFALDLSLMIETETNLFSLKTTKKSVSDVSIVTVVVQTIDFKRRDENQNRCEFPVI
jgi:hypothetical protein